jgi:hypothetical protein
MSTPSTGSAIEAGPTARALRRSRRIAGLGALVAAALLVISALVLYSGNRDRRAQLGAQAPAVVTATSVVTVGWARQQSGSVTVSFDANDGTHHVVIDVGPAVVRFDKGDDATVVYDPNHPDSARLLDVAPPVRGVPWWLYTIVGLLLAVFAALRLRGLATVRRILVSNPWVAMPSSMHEVPVQVGARLRSRQVVILDDPIDHSRTAADPTGIGRLPPSLAPVAWVAGDGGRIVLAPPPGRPLILARPVPLRPTTGN